MKKILKNPRILLWLFFIAISIILIAPNLNPSGIAVSHIEKNSSATGISKGDVIYKINDEPATKEMLKSNYTGFVNLDTNKGKKIIRANGSLGIAAEDVQPTNLRFGLDIKGGVRAIIQPNTTDNATIEQIISTLQTRINVYGLREAVFRPIYYENRGFIEISIAGGNIEELRSLMESQGKFEGKIPLSLKTNSGVAALKLDKEYQIITGNNSIEIEGKKAEKGQTITLSGMPFFVSDISDDYINLTATVFTGDDIKIVFFDPARSRIDIQDGYQWSFGVQLSQSGAQKFAWATSNTKILPGGYLDARISLYLDNRLIDSLSIASGLRGKVETEISVSGGANSMEEAKAERSKLQSILRSGALPTSIEIVQTESISPNLGTGFLKNAAIAGAAAILGIMIVVFIRYRKIILSLPMIAISGSEVLIILGMSVLIGWTIDLSAIAGIIASVGTGVDSQIIMIDQALRGESQALSLREKLKRAFFIIFGSAGTVIAAMLPLMLLGFGMLRGFAITTIIGVLVGVLIARPAYGEIIKSIIKE